jgi:hypothetical protein
MSTYTFTGTDSYSVADVRVVMQNTYEDIIGFANKGIINYEQAKKWIEDLTYLLSEKVLRSFEVQIYNSTNEKFQSYKYTTSNDGYLTSGSQSGGINYWAIPTGSKAGLFVDINFQLPKSAKVKEELARRGWGFDGSPLIGTEINERSYVSNNLKLQRSFITK